MKTYHLKIGEEIDLHTSNLEEIKKSVKSSDWSNSKGTLHTYEIEKNNSTKKIPIQLRWLDPFDNQKGAKEFVESLKLEDWLCHLPGFNPNDKKPKAKGPALGVNCGTGKGIIVYTMEKSRLTIIPSEEEVGEFEAWFNGKKITTIKIDYTEMPPTALNIEKLGKAMKLALELDSPSK